ncbi:MAG TPA: hypothetical protein VJQ52_11240 [Steroidobacteraceae bacterium]|nr:hypothetical protein [Steroidobacteraceae bacterium]
MRTPLFLLAGFLLLATCVILGRMFSSNYPGATLTVTVGFIAVWLLIAGFNMWVGVNKAGYAASEELPIFLLIFGVPAVAAAVLKWKFI